MLLYDVIFFEGMAFFSFHGKSVNSTLLAHVLDPDMEFLFWMEGAMSLGGEASGNT